MALPGSTWNQLLTAIFNDFQRLDLLSSPPVATDVIYRYAQEAISFWQPTIFIPGQAYLQWASTFAYQKYYALPSDFEVDGDILLNVFGQNVPITKNSERMMDQKDVQIPPVIGPPEFYCIYSTAANIFSPVTATWQPNFNYTSLVPATAQTPPYLILDSNGNIQALQSVSGDGLSEATAPVWPTVPGQTVFDGDFGNGVTWLTWYNMGTPNGSVLRVFPTPDNKYPMTAVYNRIIPMPVNLTDTNFWTVDAEAMIRHWCEGLIRKNVTHEPNFEADFDQATMEYAKLSGLVRKATGTGKARAHYL